MRALVLDSVFCSLQQLVLERTGLGAWWVPRVVGDTVVRGLGDALRERSGMELGELDVAEDARKCGCACMMVHGTEDGLVPVEHSEKVRRGYGGKCTLVRVEGDHNSVRPAEWMRQAAGFLAKELCTI